MATLTKAAPKGASATSPKTDVKPVTRKRKVIKTSKKETDVKNIKDTVTKIVESKREVKYIYPSEVGTDALKKKAWRAKMRDKDKAFLKEIDKLKKGEPKALLKEEKAYKAWRKTVFLVP